VHNLNAPVAPSPRAPIVLSPHEPVTSCRPVPRPDPSPVRLPVTPVPHCANPRLRGHPPDVSPRAHGRGVYIADGEADVEEARGMVGANDAGRGGWGGRRDTTTSAHSRGDR
jgi:hypothetical protein